jgi:hypothetical protein
MPCARSARTAAPAGESDALQTARAEGSQAPCRRSTHELLPLPVARQGPGESRLIPAPAPARESRGREDPATAPTARQTSPFRSFPLHYCRIKGIGPVAMRQQPQPLAAVDRDPLGGRIFLRRAHDELGCCARKLGDDLPRSRLRAGCRSRRRAVRPASPELAAAARIAPCLALSSATLAGVCRHFRSGLRRRVPRPEHGASTSTRSSLPARRRILMSRSESMRTGCTFDRPERARRGFSLASRRSATSKA